MFFFNVRMMLMLLVPGLISAASCQTTATVTSQGGASIQEAQAVPYNGPKARITVAKFSNKSAKGGGEIGEGMAEMLTTALFNTNRFIVLERQDLAAVLREQDLAAAGRIKKGTEAPTGEIEGAELLVTGTITEFEPDAGGIGGVVVTGIPLLSAAGGGVKTSHLALDIRVIDAKTSRIVAAQSVQGKAHDLGGAIGLVGPIPLGIGLGGYSKTPMEKAVRICLQAAVDFIARQTPAQYYRY